GAPTQDTIAAYTLRTYTAGVGSVFTNRLSNEFRLNYSSNSVTSSTVIDAFGGSTPVDLGRLLGIGPGSGPSVGLIYKGYNVGLIPREESGAQRQWNLIDTLSASFGRHQFKF